MLTTSAEGALMAINADTVSEPSSIRATSPPLLFATKSAFC